VEAADEDETQEAPIDYANLRVQEEKEEEKLFEDSMMLQLSATHRRHARRHYGPAQYRIPRPFRSAVNLFHRQPHGYEYNPRQMARRKFARKMKMARQYNTLSHQSSHKDDEEEFSKKLHKDVENGIEDQEFVKKVKRSNPIEPVGPAGDKAIH
jgi:hypothetical protein